MMALPNDSIVFPNPSVTTASNLTSSKEYPVTHIADAQGHLQGSKPIYVYMIPSTVHVAVANTIFWDMWNGDAALIVRVLSVRLIPNVTTAVTGVVFDWLLERTSAIGTTGTAQTAWLPDLSQTALDADITCRLKPGGGATASTDLYAYSISSEETATATLEIAAQGGYDFVPPYLQPQFGGGGIVLRPSQGIRMTQVTNSVAGNTGFSIAFSVE